MREFNPDGYEGGENINLLSFTLTDVLYNTNLEHDIWWDSVWAAETSASARSAIFSTTIWRRHLK